MRTSSVGGLPQDAPGLDRPRREYSEVGSAKQSWVWGLCCWREFVRGKRRFGERKREREKKVSWAGCPPPILGEVAGACGSTWRKSNCTLGCTLLVSGLTGSGALRLPQHRWACRGRQSRAGELGQNWSGDLLSSPQGGHRVASQRAGNELFGKEPRKAEVSPRLKLVFQTLTV